MFFFQLLILFILAMVEYSLDLDIPDYVFEDPTFQAMSDATTDIMTWPNVSIDYPSLLLTPLTRLVY